MPSKPRPHTPEYTFVPCITTSCSMMPLGRTSWMPYGYRYWNTPFWSVFVVITFHVPSFLAFNSSVADGAQMLTNV